MGSRANQFKIIEATATTATASSAFLVDEITLLSNDGTDDITFTLDNGTDFTLKKGESLKNLPVGARVLHYIAASGTQAFRAWGVKP